MGLFDLPPALLLLVLGDTALAASGYTAFLPFKNGTGTPQPVTTGSSYASACAASYNSYSSAYDSWSQDHAHTRPQTNVVGGPSERIVTYYENATTLCDGFPRVTYSPAVSLSTGTITIPATTPLSTEVEYETYYYGYPSPSPSCSIAPSDCDPLWAEYSASLTAWQARNATKTAGGAAQITAPPQTPPCWNQSEASQYVSATSSMYGCGLCTIFGQDVELVYFPVPTTVARDMCATSPSASLSHYGPGAVIEAYAGTAYGANATRTPTAATAILGHNTFTSGTAYISIGSVWAEDRCSSTLGTPVSNAILAMPSESVLSLRYRQDHFQYFAVTSTQTGFPISYADFNDPVPYSAWIGQEQCEGPWDTWHCGVIYENQYRPQLAIPPGIKKLNPAWEGCQMWYGGLYDPPVALQPAESEALPTRPHASLQLTKTAEPVHTIAVPTSTATALADQDGDDPQTWSDGGHSDAAPTSQPNQNGEDGSHAGPQGGNVQQPSTPPAGSNGGNPQMWSHQNDGNPTPTSNADSACGGQQGGSWHHDISAGGQTWQVSACDGQACVDGVTVSAGGPAQSISGGAMASYDSEGCFHVAGSTAAHFPLETNNNDVPGPSRPGQAHEAVITAGGATLTAVQGGQSGAVVVNGVGTLTPGAPAITMSNGQILSAGDNGLVVGWSSAVEVDAVAASATSNGEAHDGVSGAQSGAQSSAAQQDQGSVSVTISRTMTSQLASDRTGSDDAAQTSTGVVIGQGSGASSTDAGATRTGAQSGSQSGSQSSDTATSIASAVGSGPTHAFLIAMTFMLVAYAA